ncbi:hypothetical protein GH714_043919 [Hevea brasiliensis]|uniref:Uncharacterized protein n=1 Tax=Hevea brasiliensis TaxID=3981 RepID=A0A6A6K2Q2_HEVBR|nr:hypothetical protein GH714_043919 [Hevea brasiliensis]
MSVLNSGYRVGFDYGAEVRPDGNLIKWKTEGKKLCLVDGDILPYTVGFIVKPEAQIRAAMRVDDGDKDLLTKSTGNFRIDQAFTKPYKGKRPADKPPFFYELREYLLSTQDAILADGEEADDLMSIEAWRLAREFCEMEGIEVGSNEHKAFANYVVISKDKDLMQVPGWHLHYKDNSYSLEWVTRMGYLRPKYKAKDGKMKKLEGGGLMFLYAQILMGDDIDNYPGLPKCGMNTVFMALKDCKDERELYFTTLALYKKRYGEAYPAINYRSSKAWADGITLSTVSLRRTMTRH